MKTNNYLTVFLLLLALLPASLAAQSSLTLDNTAGIFSNDIDDFMDPNDYENVEFDNYFLEFQGSSAGAPPLVVGFATNFGDMYTGFYYSGNILNYQKNAGDINSNSINNLELLLGSPSFGGIKLGLGLNLYKEKISGVTADANIYTFSAGWGKNFELSNGTTLKPEVNAFYMSTSSKVSVPGLGNFSIFDINYIFGLSLETDWILSPKGDAERSWTFGYNFAFGDADFMGMDVTPLDHGLTASYKQVYNLSEKFSAGLSAGVEVNYLSYSYSTSGIELSWSALLFIPNAAAAFTYKFDTPFSVNAGLDLAYPIIRDNASVSFSGFPSVSNTTVTYPGFTVTTTAGGSFEPYPGLAIDFSWRSPNGYYDVDMGVITLAVRIKK